MSDLQSGDVVTMKRFVWSTDCADLTFAKLSGNRKYGFLFLGAGSPEKPLDADFILNALGWVFNPEMARTAIADRNPAGQDAEERLGAKHESGGGEANRPTPEGTL